MFVPFFNSLHAIGMPLPSFFMIEKTKRFKGHHPQATLGKGFKTQNINVCAITH
jgi:hypothetical protein